LFIPEEIEFARTALVPLVLEDLGSDESLEDRTQERRSFELL
jgi:hypothetical protein